MRSYLWILSGFSWKDQITLTILPKLILYTTQMLLYNIKINLFLTTSSLTHSLVCLAKVFDRWIRIISILLLNFEACSWLPAVRWSICWATCQPRQYPWSIAGGFVVTSIVTFFMLIVPKIVTYTISLVLKLAPSLPLFHICSFSYYIFAVFSSLRLPFEWLCKVDFPFFLLHYSIPQTFFPQSSN